MRIKNECIVKDVFGLWIGRTLPVLALLCIKSYQQCGFRFHLLTYEPILNLPEGVIILDAGFYLPPVELFLHSSGSLAPTADRLRYLFLSINGGLWTDMDVLCLRPFNVPAYPMFGLQEKGLANLAVLCFPSGNEVMINLAKLMNDPTEVMPWDTPNEIENKAQWRANVPDLNARRTNAEWSLGGPEGFTCALKHFGYFHLAMPIDVFNAVHYTTWRWTFNGVVSVEDNILKNSLAIHLWGEMLRREPDALIDASPESLVSKKLTEYGLSNYQYLSPTADRRNSILVGICSCRKYKDKRDSIRDTWMRMMPASINAVFFVGDGHLGNLPQETDTIALDCPDDYNHLPIKVRAFFSFALNHFDFDWLFKCDDDTYIETGRLMSLIRADVDLVGNYYVEERGSPSGGAGYLLSRKLVQALADDPNLPVTGDEDVIHGQAATTMGFKSIACHQLKLDCSTPPTSLNDVITSHWCTCDRMRSIFTNFHEIPGDHIFVQHSLWSDEIILYSNGLFQRPATGCSGRFIIHENSLELAWFDWASETFLHVGKHLISHPLPLEVDRFQLHNAFSIGDLLVYDRLYVYAWKFAQVPPEWQSSHLSAFVNLGNPPFDCESFDYIVIDNVFHFIDVWSFYHTLLSCSKMLKPGGVLAISFFKKTSIDYSVLCEYRKFIEINSRRFESSHFDFEAAYVTGDVCSMISLLLCSNSLPLSAIPKSRNELVRKLLLTTLNDMGNPLECDLVCAQKNNSLLT